MSISPGSIETHRADIAASDGATPPLASHASWLRNPGGFRTARVYAYVDFTGGTSPSLVLRPWVRSPGSTAGKVGKGEAVAVTGDDQAAIDVDVNGDDLLVFVESVAGSPTSFDVDLFVSWR